MSSSSLRRASNRFVRIVEVGPRDGLQNESKILSTRDKLNFIKLLAESGLKTVEASSFVSPKWVPQMADAKEITAELKKDNSGTIFPVLIPNMKGFETFYDQTQGKMKDIAVFTSASEGFSQKNTNCSVSESIERLEQVTKVAQQKGIRVRGYVSCIVKCPYDGRVNEDSVLKVTSELLEMGCYEVSLGDTLGVGTPGDMERILESLLEAKINPDKLALHCHDTYGQALSNVLKALEMGVRTFDSSCSGLGGCPYAPGASGNLATEDLVYMLQGSGFECGVDLGRLLVAGKFISEKLNAPSRSKVFNALASSKR